MAAPQDAAREAQRTGTTHTTLHKKQRAHPNAASPIALSVRLHIAALMSTDLFVLAAVASSAASSSVPVLTSEQYDARLWRFVCRVCVRHVCVLATKERR